MPLCPILIGREPESARLRAALSGSGEVLLVSGEAGIGKSRLLREFASEAGQEGHPVIWARAEVVAVPGPYGLILDLLDNIASTLSGPVADEARAIFVQLLEPAAGSLARASSLPRHIAARLRGLLASERPAPIVILEDLHAVDDASLTVVFHVGRTSRDDGRLLLASARTSNTSISDGFARMVDALKRDRILTEIRLDRLNNDQVIEVVKAILGREPDPALRTTIETLGDGIPFFLEELTPDASATWQSETPAPLPRSIRDNVIRQFDTLPPPVQELLLTAALLEGPLEPGILSPACSVSLDSVLAHLASARGAGVLVEEQHAFVFRHALVRHVFASMSDTRETTTRHESLAVALESFYAGSASNAWLIALHFHRAGQGARATEHALRAADHALSLAATADARVAFQAAKEWAPDESTHRRAQNGLVLVELREGNDALAAEIARDIADRVKASGLKEEAAAALGRLSLVLSRTGDRKGAAAALDEGLGLIEPLARSTLAARLMAQKANLLTFYLGRFDEAEDLLRHAIATAEALSEQAVLAVALDGSAEISSWRGNFSTAERLGNEALDQATNSKDPEAIGRTHNNHAVRLILHGRARAGLEVLLAGRELVERNYGSAGVSSLDITRAWAYQMMGEPQSALQLLRALGSVWMGWRGLAAAIKTWAHVERAEIAEASLVLNHAWREAGFVDWRAATSQEVVNPDVMELLAAEIHTRIALNELPEAAGAAQGYVDVSQTVGQVAERTRARALSAMTFALAKQIPRAQMELQALDELLKQRPYPIWLGAQAEISGLIATAAENEEVAVSAFRTAATHFASCSNALDQARCLRRGAEILARTESSYENVKEALTRARELALNAGGLAEISRTEALLRSIGVRPRAGRPRKNPASGPLSAREEQIAGLVAAGATNPEIAKRLYLSEGTVAGYISSALRKLQLPGRAALAAWSAKAGLV